MERRTFIAKSVGGVTVLSGVALPASAAQDAETDDLRPPQVAELDEERWGLLDDSTDVHERSLGLTSITAHERTRVWEDQMLRARLREVTQGALDETMMLFFATRLEIEGLLSGGVRVADIEDVAMPEFEERLENHGLENVRTVPRGEPNPELGSRGETHEYAAEYPVQDLAQGGGVGSVDLDDGPLAVTGLLSIWLGESNTAYVAGGLFPAENYGGPGAGTVDFELTPDQYRQDVVDLVESTY